MLDNALTKSQIAFEMNAMRSCFSIILRRGVGF
jgi:hypothetical protein